MTRQPRCGLCVGEFAMPCWRPATYLARLLNSSGWVYLCADHAPLVGGTRGFGPLEALTGEAREPARPNRALLGKLNR